MSLPVGIPTRRMSIFLSSGLWPKYVTIETSASQGKGSRKFGRFWDVDWYERALGGSSP